MRFYRTILVFPLFACAANSTLGGSSTSTVNGTGSTVATLSMISSSVPVTAELATTPDKAWAQVSGAYQDVGIPLTFSVNEVRMAGNQGVNLHRQLTGVGLRNYFLCGDASGGPNADIYTIALNVATQIQATGDGMARSSTVLDATGIPMTSGTNSVRCGSTGELERRINDAISKRVAGK